MRGKQKQAQRTKNNVRPSNSGRSAELLGNSTGKLFTTLKNNANYIGPASNQDTEANIPQDFQLCIKKMSKKDPVTRQKGLQEFVELCRTSDTELLKSLLPFWPRLYCTLATDIDYRVREAAQQAHRAIVVTVKRDIAPYLKQLMGAWFVSPYDSHASAASIAKNSFQTAFPMSKRTEAIVFAQKEILNYIVQNIIHETPETLFTQSKHFLADDIDARYQRIVASNLLGYSQYLDKLPRDQLLQAKEDNKELILSTTKFWKYAKDESKTIKASWFTALLTLIDRAPTFLEDYHKKVCSSIFTNFDDDDANVLPLVWETTLHSCDIIPDWWIHVSADKLVFPKLWRVLQEAAFGHATVVYPMLLPLLSKIELPSSMSAEDFYSKLLSSLRTGLASVKIQRNSSEMEVVLSTIFECLRYIVNTNLDNKELCLALIENHLVVFLRKALQDGTMYGISATIFSQVSSLLRYWSRIHAASSVYKEGVEKVWMSVHSLLCDSGTTEKPETNALIGKDDLEKKLRIQYKLVSALKNPPDHHQKKQVPVKFSSSVRNEDHAHERADKETSKRNSLYNDRLRLIVNDLIQKYYCMTNGSFDCAYLFVNQLCSILNLCSEKHYYQLLTNIVIASSGTEKADESSQLMNDLIRRWLSDNRVSVDAVLNVVFHLLIYLKDHEKVSILHSISEDHMNSMLELCLNLANDSQLQASVKKWLTSSSFKTTLNTFAHEVAEVWPPSMEKVNVLKTCFRVSENVGESYTNDETKLEILKIFRDSLQHNSPQQFHKDNLSCIANILMEVFEPHNHSLLEKNHTIVTSIIGYLFLFGCDTDNNLEDNDVLNEAWMQGVKTLAKIFGCTSDNFIIVTEQFAYAVVELLEKCKCKARDVKQIINFVCMYIQCLPIAAEVDKNNGTKKEEVRRTYDEEVLTEPLATYTDITSLICEVFLKNAVQYCHDKMESNIVQACLKSEFYNGTLTYCKLASQNELTEYDYIFSSDAKVEVDINECFASVAKLYNVAYYIVTVINHYLLIPTNKSREEDDVKTADEGKTLNEAIVQPFLARDGLEKLNESVVYVVYLLAVLKSFHQNFKHVRHYDQISESDLIELESITSDIVGMHPRSPILLLKLAVMNKAFQCGNFWAEALFLLFTELMNVDNVNEAYQEIVKCYEVSDHQSSMHILHITELFARVAQFRIELYSPDAKLDEEKLSVLTCYLRAIKENKFTPDQDRIIWYWLDTILIHKKQLEVTFNKNLAECQPSEILLAGTVCRFLSVVTDGRIPLMTDRRTDFMMIALASWMQSIHKTCTNPTYEDNVDYNMPICVFISAACDMFKSISVLASNVSYSDRLFMEWNNVFAAETHTIISYDWRSLSESEGCRNVEQFLVLNSFSDLIIKHVDFVHFVVRPDLNFWLCACSDLLQSYCTPVRLAAFSVLMELSMEMVTHDSSAKVVEDMDEKLMLEILSISSLQTIVNIVLSSYRNGDNRVLDPNTDSYVYVHSYLLVWMVVMQMCLSAKTEVRFRYATWLKEEGYLEIFLHNLLALMPEKVQRSNLSDGAIKKMREFFTAEPNFTLEERWDEQKLSSLVCRLYHLALWLLPAFVRQWWKTLEHKDSQTVDRLTTRFVSPSLIMEDMRAIKREKPIENFTMTGYPTTRQIVAAYSVEDTTMEVTMQLATNHPLGIVKVDSAKVGVLSNRWRTWAKQLNMYLAHQNGLIRDGIISWKNNVDKAFEGVEECYICFSIVHSSNYQLPKQSCRTCHKKFHPLCLYRWFITSNKSTCPICRNLF